MAIDKPTDYFRTKTYTGNGSTQSITFDESDNMKPDWVWIKDRDDGSSHAITDSVRGNTKYLMSNDTYQEETLTDRVTSFDSNGFSLSSSAAVNQSSSGNVAWCWLAGGTAPTKTYTVKVVSDSGNKYRFDDFGTSAVTLDLQEGGTYTFDQSDSSNSGHPFRFSTTSNGTHGGGSEYTTGVTTTGTPGSSGAKTVITVGSGVATLYYYCTQHSGMGGQANTNSTHGSSYFDGDIQSTVSANVEAGFSIVTFTGNGSNSQTVSHGLSQAPEFIILKARGQGTYGWLTYDAINGAGKYMSLNGTHGSVSDTGMWSNTAPTSSVFSLSNGGNTAITNPNGVTMVAYCFHSVKNFSKVSSYIGNGSTNGTYSHLGFKPAFVMLKRSNTTGTWQMMDNKRDTFNVTDQILTADGNGAEFTGAGSGGYVYDFLSNGFKAREDNSYTNASGSTYIYLSIAETPFVTSKKIPTTAR